MHINLQFTPFLNSGQILISSVASSVVNRVTICSPLLQANSSTFHASAIISNLLIIFRALWMFTRILVPKVLEPKLRYNMLGLANGTKPKSLLLRLSHASCYSLCRLVSAFVVLIITCSICKSIFSHNFRGCHLLFWEFKDLIGHFLTSLYVFFPQVITVYDSTLNFMFIPKYIIVFAQWQVNAKSSNIVLFSH